MKKKREHILMLLNVDHFFGEHSGRTGPAVLFIALTLLPLVICVNYGIFILIPIKFILPVWLIYAVRLWLLILGKENERLDNFKKSLKDIYYSVVNLINIKFINDNGMIFYLNGRISYVIVAYNGTNVDDILHAKAIKKFLEAACDKRDFDIYIQNVSNIDSITTKYDNISLVSNIDAAKDFIDIIDYNRKIVRENTTLQKLVIVVKGHTSDWKVMDVAINSAINSNASRAFKTVYKVTNKDEIQEIISRDINGLINVNDILKKKYFTNEFYGSKVLEYDDVTHNKKKQKPMTRTVDTPKETYIGFHTTYTNRR